MDDIKGENASSDGADPAAKSGPRSIGPESETRGGAEAPDDGLPERDPTDTDGAGSIKPR